MVEHFETFKRFGDHKICKGRKFLVLAVKQALLGERNLAKVKGISFNFLKSNVGLKGLSHEK